MCQLSDRCDVVEACCKAPQIARGSDSTAAPVRGGFAEGRWQQLVPRQQRHVGTCHSDGNLRVCITRILHLFCYSSL